MTHGPGMHGPLITVVILILLAGALIYGLYHLVKSRRNRTLLRRDPESDRGPERSPEGEGPQA